MKNNKKQTAVEWFAFELSKLGLLPDGVPDEIYNKAKEMEREKIIKAHGVQFDYSYSQIDPKKITGEQYYNETYGGKNENNY